MPMPRSFKAILKHADELAARFDEMQPTPGGVRDARSLRDLREAVLNRARAEAGVADAVTVARAEGHSWSAIGAMLGTSGEAARQRYGADESGDVEFRRARQRAAVSGSTTNVPKGKTKAATAVTERRTTTTKIAKNVKAKGLAKTTSKKPKTSGALKSAGRRAGR
jgi:hypothetical protein